MPPYVPRKKRKSVSPVPEPQPPAKKRQIAKSTKKSPAKSKASASIPTAAETRAFIATLEDDDDSSSGASSDDEFEDVLHTSNELDAQVSEDEMHWEDVVPTNDPPLELKDLEVTLTPHDVPSTYAIAKSGKKGPTKIERFIRTNTHCMHILCLMWANTIRNSWLNDEELHKILMHQLSEGVRREIDRWRTASGLDLNSSPTKAKKKQQTNSKKSRDWPADAKKLESGAPDMSSGDPLIKLLRHLVSFWKKRFTVTSPSLRKRGYRSVKDRDSELRAFRINNSNIDLFGERIETIEVFRSLARRCQGSADVGAHLFTALLRAIGIESRMVASLQPAGFGWSQAEEAKKLELGLLNTIIQTGLTAKEPIEISDGESNSPVRLNVSAAKGKSRLKTETNSSQGDADPSSELSELSSSDFDSKDIDLEELTDKSKAQIGNDRRILPFPTYWSEALSPVTHTYIPVSIFTNPSIAFKSDFLSVFEPRGAAAEKAKQVICYVIAHSSDGTAKDITVRYLKRHQLPGRTKGFRLLPEKIPLYNKNGKVVKHLEVDWFGRVMRFYNRPNAKRTIADDIEDQGDLVPVKGKISTGARDEDAVPETLQAFKNSTEYVLERHLRREEAVLPSAKVVRYFTTGKGDKAKKEAVFLRKDVVVCKTAESWHKEGREVRIGEQPLKQVTIRAVTLLRKMEIEEAMRHTGEKPLQGLYSRDQTIWIIPEPIKDGFIPKNNFGNIDVYVPSMVPQGAVHIPYRGLKSVCKKLGIEFAEACTGFEFGHQIAVPILTGVVVAEGNRDLVVDAWRVAEERKKKREEEKSRIEALTLWRRFANGLRILERVKHEYGRMEQNISGKAFIQTTQKTEEHEQNLIKHVEDEGNDEVDEYQGGGFIPEGMTIEEAPTKLDVNDFQNSQEQDSHTKLSNGKAKIAPRSLRSILPDDATTPSSKPQSLSSHVKGNASTKNMKRKPMPLRSKSQTSSNSEGVSEPSSEGSDDSDSQEDENVEFKGNSKANSRLRKSERTSEYFKRR